MVNAVKVFKKSTPSGKITVYLGRRDFVDITNGTVPVDGVLIVDNDYLRGRKVFATVTVTYRFGREEDEVMGLHFSRDLKLTCQQIYPSTGKVNNTQVQERLLKKFGGGAQPFAVTLPDNAPCSVQLHPGAEGTAKPLGVIYELKIYAADDEEEKPHRRNMITLAVRKVQYSPAALFTKQPKTHASRGFTFSSGKVNMEMTLDKELHYHGEHITPTVLITNNSKKTVKQMKCSIIQHVEVTMTNNHFSREVACLDTREGCPITPDHHLKKTFTICPTASNHNKIGIALDGKIKDTDANLASSTLSKSVDDAMGIVVYYTVRVALALGSLTGELVAELPIKIMHPAPDSKTEGEEIQFEDFARLRRGVSLENQI